MIVINRFHVPADRESAFHELAEPALALLRTKAGVREVELVRNLDDSELWALVTRWENVGSYRRALGGMESKLTIVPFLSLSIDEPSAYDSSENVGLNVPRVR